MKTVLELELYSPVSLDTYVRQLYALINSTYYDVEVLARDTHHWVETDGFYEVEFVLRVGSEEIYLTTISGGQDLEDKWSKESPKSASFYEALCDFEDDSWKYACLVARLLIFLDSCGIKPPDIVE